MLMLKNSSVTDNLWNGMVNRNMSLSMIKNILANYSMQRSEMQRFFRKNNISPTLEFVEEASNFMIQVQIYPNSWSLLNKEF